MRKRDLEKAAKKGKHIFMPKADAIAFLAMLRSGEVKQGTGRLFDGQGYCCLGAMQAHKSGGQIEVLGYEGTDPAYLAEHIEEFSACAPTLTWLKRVGWTFTNKSGHRRNNPYLPSIGMTAIAANDGHNLTFAEIADAMEKAIQYTD